VNLEHENETKKIKEEKEKSLNVSNHTRVTSYTNKNMQEPHKTKKNTYLRKAAAIDRDGGSGFVSLNVPPRSSKFRFEAFSKPVFRSFPNFASDLFFICHSYGFYFLCLQVPNLHKRRQKHTLILLRSAWIKLERELQLPDLRLVLCRLHCMCSLLELRYKMAQIRQISKKKISRSPDFDDNFQ
jgi:hypothetical protein